MLLPLPAGDWDLARGDGALRLPTGGVGQGGGVPKGLPEMFEIGLLGIGDSIEKVCPKEN